jgi:anti-sigma factor RsiW
VNRIWQRIRGGRQPGLTCAEVVELVTDYLEGALADGERARFEEHLAACDGCTSYVEQIRLTIEVVGHVEPDDLSDAAKAELLAAFGDWARR